MGYDVELVDKKDNLIRVSPHCEGSLQVMGGNTNAEIGVTYNYSGFYYDIFPEDSGIYFLHKKKAKDCIKELKNAVSILGTERSGNYWDSTSGNAGYALNTLLKW